MTDEQLLERLTAVLIPAGTPSAPPTASLQVLHRAIDATTPSRAKTPPRRWRPRALTIAVATSVAAACIAIVMVTTSLPRIGRETTTRVTVTATSPALGEVADRQRALETALGDGDASAVVIASARLRVALNALTSSEWLPIRAEIGGLLARTETFLEGRGGDVDETPGGPSTPSSTTQPGVSSSLPRPTTSAPVQATSPAAPPPTVPASTRPTAATSATVTVSDVEDAVAGIDDDDDNSGHGGDDTDGGDDNSGPGGGPGDDDSGPGSD